MHQVTAPGDAARADDARAAGPLPAPPAGRTGWPWDWPAPPAQPLMPDGSAWPRISLITPSYNQADYIEATLRSVLLQGYPNLEYIVVDGASADASVEVIRRYEPWLDHWRSEPDRGQPDAINKGFAMATGEIYGFLNSDDMLLPGALRRVALAARARPDAMAWVGACYRIDTDGRVTDTIRPRGLTRDGLADWGANGLFYQPSCFIAAAGWERAGPFDLRLEYGFDVDLWLKLIELGPFVELEDILSAALFHPLAKSGQGRMGQHVDTIALQVYHGHIDAAMRRLGRLMGRRRVRDLVWLAARERARTLARGLAFWKRERRPLLTELLERERPGGGAVPADVGGH